MEFNGVWARALDDQGRTFEFVHLWLRQGATRCRTIAEENRALVAVKRKAALAAKSLGVGWGLIIKQKG
jgi:hypothetical protein